MEEFLRQLHSIRNTEDLSIKQMFDVCEQLITEQSDEIFGINTNSCGDSSWKHFSLIGDEQVISVQRTKVYVFCKEYISSYRKSLQNGYVHYKNFIMTNEENNDTKYTINNDMNNHNAQDLHE